MVESAVRALVVSLSKLYFKCAKFIVQSVAIMETLLP